MKIIFVAQVHRSLMLSALIVTLVSGVSILLYAGTFNPVTYRNLQHLYLPCSPIQGRASAVRSAVHNSGSVKPDRHTLPALSRVGQAMDLQLGPLYDGKHRSHQRNGRLLPGLRHVCQPVFADLSLATHHVNSSFNLIDHANFGIFK